MSNYDNLVAQITRLHSKMRIATANSEITWKHLPRIIKNRRQKQRINSSLDAHQLAEYCRGTMGSDNTPLTPCQCQINNVVRDTFHEWVGSPQHTVFTDRQIDRAICALHKNVSASIDGISAEYSRSRRDVTRLSNKRSPYLFGVATANRTKVTTPNKYGAKIIARMSDWENFIYGNSEILISLLLAIYNSMFNWTTVPSVLVTGIIIPILKKSTLDPNIVNNFRPITLGSTHGKLIEFLILPADMAHPNQFGFRKGRVPPWHAVILMICLYIVNPRGPRCIYVA